MKNFGISIVAVALCLYACSTNGSKQNTDPETAKLKHEKFITDSSIKAEKLLVFVKLKDKKTIIPAPRGQYFPNVEVAYNVFRNEKGKVVYIAEIPKSPKDDWFISYKSYFREDGSLLAFERLNNFFGSKCTKGAAMEDMIKYYKEDFSLIDSVYTLTDTNHQALDKTTCKFPYNFEYKVNKNLKEYLDARGFEL